MRGDERRAERGLADVADDAGGDMNVAAVAPCGLQACFGVAVAIELLAVAAWAWPGQRPHWRNRYPGLQ